MSKVNEHINNAKEIIKAGDIKRAKDFVNTLLSIYNTLIEGFETGTTVFRCKTNKILNLNDGVNLPIDCDYLSDLQLLIEKLELYNSLNNNVSNQKNINNINNSINIQNSNLYKTKISNENTINNSTQEANKKPSYFWDRIFPVLSLIISLLFTIIFSSIKIEWVVDNAFLIFSIGVLLWLIFIISIVYLIRKYNLINIIIAFLKKRHTRNYIAKNISDFPTAIFSDRLHENFPGLRGLHKFSYTKQIGKKIENILNNQKGLSISDSFWWKGRRGSNPIKIFSAGNKKSLMDCHELIIDHIYVFFDAYWREFIYLYCKSDLPTGLYSFDKNYIKKTIDLYGYIDEEYALYNKKYITREEYDDGAFERNGKLIKTKGKAKLRIRYLSPYNLIICAKDNPIIKGYHDIELENNLDSILIGNSSVEELAKVINTYERC